MIQSQSSTNPIERATENVAVCQEYLKTLSAACCLTERSSRINTLIAGMDKFAHGLSNMSGIDPSLDRKIMNVIDLGGEIGQLHVSCCSPAREQLYQRLLKTLNDIHTDLWAAKGVSH